MKLTVVMDNMVPFGASKPFVGEHGYSLLIETAGKRVLLDAGQSEAVVRNLSLLGVHPDELDAIVISHGHFDHAGGLAATGTHGHGKAAGVIVDGNIARRRGGGFGESVDIFHFLTS